MAHVSPATAEQRRSTGARTPLVGAHLTRQATATRREEIGFRRGVQRCGWALPVVALWRVGIGAVLVVTLWLGLGVSAALAERSFGLRFEDNRRGDVIGTGNTLLTCVGADPLCADARAGTGGGAANNNSRAMTYVDVDGDGKTFDSSSAALSLPAGATVLWAGLYWGGRWQAGKDVQSPFVFKGEQAPAPANRNKVKLLPPGGTEYLSIASEIDPVDAAGAPKPEWATQGPRIYQGFATITGIVQASVQAVRANPSLGNRYMVADVQLGTGLQEDQSGGWAILVAYENPSEPLRNLTVFDGLKFVSTDQDPRVPVDIPLSGFLTPPSPAPVKTRVGLVAYEGDIGTVNDTAELNYGLANAKLLTNGANPANNFFNSSISDTAGTILTDRNRNDRNTFGFDADFFESTQYLSNDQRETVLRLTTNGDGYAPGAVVFSTDLFGPRIDPVKSVDKAEAQLGELLTYRIVMRNSGFDPATNVVFTDAIPANTNYEPGSLTIVDGANTGVMTDVPGDDQAEVVAGSVVFRLGTGATGTTGGELAIGASTTVQFQVRVLRSGLPLGTRIVNSGTVGLTAQTSGETGSAKTNVVTTGVVLPDLALEKTSTGDFEAGGSAAFQIAVRNVGQAPTQGLTVVTDDLPPGVTLDGTPGGDGWTCAATSGGFRCGRSDPLAANASFPTIHARVRIAEDAAGSRLVNSATVRTPEDPNELNDTDTAGGDVPLPDLAIQKVALTPEVFPEDEVRYRITVLNRGPVQATNVVVSEELALDLALLTVKPSKGECSNRTCRLGTLARNEQVTIEVTAVADRNSGGNTLVNRVRVDATQRDLNPDDNADEAVVRVTPEADVVVEKTAAAPTLVAGGIAQFLVVVRNDGPSTATEVTVEDVVPSGLEPISFVPSQGTCEANRCSLGTLADGGVAEILVFLRSAAAQAGQTFVNVSRGSEGV